MSEAKSVAFINRSYWPDVEATGQFLTDLCEFLAPRWNVKVLAGSPNRISEDAEPDSASPRARNGVSIDRLFHTRFRKATKVGRLANLLTFTASAAVVNRSRLEGSDIIVTETDPFFLPLIGPRLARRSGARLVIYLQDIYPDIAVALNQIGEGAITRQLRSMLRKAYSSADRIVVLDDDMKDRIMGWGIDSHKISVVPNWVDCSRIKPEPRNNSFRAKHVTDDAFVIMHSGNMGLCHNLEVLIDAVCSSGISSNTQLLLVGDGVKKRLLIEQSRKAEFPSRVRFLDYQPRCHLSESLSAADLHVVSMHAEIAGCMSPSKLYGILASGTPILAIVPKSSHISEFVKEKGLGWVVSPGDTVGVQAAINAAQETPQPQMKAMGARGRRIAETYFDAKRCMSLFETQLQHVLHGESLPIASVS